eukprot:11167192-Lingulodinium_polyedra.AAC.1
MYRRVHVFIASYLVKTPLGPMRWYPRRAHLGVGAFVGTFEQQRRRSCTATVWVLANISTP